MVFFAFHNPSVSLREPPPFTQGRLFYSPFFVTIPHKLKFENKVKVFLRQHRTILIVQMRRQIFRQTNQKDAGEMDFRQGILVQYDGKDASSCVIKATAANCAVLP